MKNAIILGRQLGKQNMVYRSTIMQYEIKQGDTVMGTALNIEAANLFAQALRERYRDIDFTVHPIK